MLLILVAAVCLTACTSRESLIQEALNQRSGTVRLPSGTVEISFGLRLPAGAEDLEVLGGTNTVLRASRNFRGRAILSCTRGKKIRFRNFAIEGNRSALDPPLEMGSTDKPFRAYYNNNGLLADEIDGLEIINVKFREIANFPVLVSRSHRVKIDGVLVDRSGSLNHFRRNNATGGIILEEGTSDFQVIRCWFHDIRGNAVWTHSLYTSPRNKNGVIAQNRFDTIGRDAVQVGHATAITVENNEAKNIGFPSNVVDVESEGVPAALDTAGNVDHTIYASNHLEEINGKCMDLDGFHDGEVRGNTCTNRGRPEDYPYGNFGIIMNNTNPDMRSENISIIQNEIRGAKFGGIFIIGTGHKIIANRLLGLNTAHCNESAARFGCYYAQDDPNLLQSGIYLSRGLKRPQDTRNNVIRENLISGYKMKTRCIAAGPAVPLHQNQIEANECADEVSR